MARNLQVYPKAYIEGSQWLFVTKVRDTATGATSRFEHPETAGVTSERPLLLLKLVFDMTVPDGTLDPEIDAALYTLDIRPGPQTETVWGNWQALAEGIIAGLTAGYTENEFWAEWRKQDTNAVRTDARRALITLQTGWSIDVGSIHQHEGDGTVTNE